MATVASTLTSASVLKVAAQQQQSPPLLHQAIAVRVVDSRQLIDRDRVNDTDGFCFNLGGRISHTTTNIGRKSRKSKSTVSAMPIRGSTLPVQHDQSDMDDYDHSVGDANTTKGASSGAKKDKRRGRTKKPALIWTESANEDADEKHYNYGCFWGWVWHSSGPRRSPRCGRWR
ncbi:hypothetical protein BASA61_009245 [Batrachochytrium salamandrivorans]|nr:hypothetical protein BASA61_009245 [Batrachochytrium salamandrivorans]